MPRSKTIKQLYLEKLIEDATFPTGFYHIVKYFSTSGNDKNIDASLKLSNNNMDDDDIFPRKKEHHLSQQIIDCVYLPKD